MIFRLGSLVLALSLCCVEAQQRPNILFIFSDDHATEAISSYGGKFADLAPTPNLDRLADEGALLENSFCCNSICGPSRAAVLTGVHSHRNGYLDNSNSSFDGSQTTFPKLLKKSGYQTAIVGKWHLKSEPEGFDYWEVLPGQGAYYNPDFLSLSENEETVTKRYPGYVTEVVTDLGLDWLKNKRDKEKPFLLMCQHKAPHRNWSPAAKYYQLFDKVDFPEPVSLFDDYKNRSVSLAQNAMSLAKDFQWGHDLKLMGDNQFPNHFVTAWGNPEYGRMSDSQKQLWDAAYKPRHGDLLRLMEKHKEDKNLSAKVTRWKYQRYIKDYLRCIRSVDDSVGELLDYLDESGLAENTIVIYGSDQGFYLGEHGWYDKRWMFEESLEMPFLIRWPGVVKPAMRPKSLIQNIDYAPTFLEIAGVEVPSYIQGRSLLPVLKGEVDDGFRQAIYYTYYGEAIHNVAKHDGVRTARYKLIHFPNTKEWNLFDLKVDPNEMHSFHQQPDYAGVLAKMKTIYHKKRVEYQVSTATIPQARFNVAWWDKRHQLKLKEAAAGEHELLLLGDSITHGFEGKGRKLVTEHWAKFKPLNLGYSGDRTEHVLWRLLNGEMPKSDPKVAMLMIGTNNTGHSMQAAKETADGIEQIIQLLRDRKPDMEILLLGIFPRGHLPSDPERMRNEEINALITKYAAMDKVHYLDLSATFLDQQGKLPKSVMPDMLHPNPQGYKLWVEAVNPKLAELGLK